jgi:hypothetical protein
MMRGVSRQVDRRLAVRLTAERAHTRRHELRCPYLYDSLDSSSSTAWDRILDGLGIARDSLATR